ncbi:uncharacterized protein NH340_JMT00560 [Sarcoptes scabiei]|nr:uncharacterized protein NH340_JMT00560 [Sarcoptes scabiei]
MSDQINFGSENLESTSMSVEPSEIDIADQLSSTKISTCYERPIPSSLKERTIADESKIPNGCNHSDESNQNYIESSQESFADLERQSLVSGVKTVEITNGDSNSKVDLDVVKTRRRYRPRKNSTKNSTANSLQNEFSANESIKNDQNISNRRSTRLSTRTAKKLDKEVGSNSESIYDVEKRNGDCDIINDAQSNSLQDQKINKKKSENAYKSKKKKAKDKKTKTKSKKSLAVSNTEKQNSKGSDNLFNGKSNIMLDESNPDVNKHEKVKSRWLRNSEIENSHIEDFSKDNGTAKINDNDSIKLDNNNRDLSDKNNPTVSLPTFEEIEENLFLFERKKSKAQKDTKKMVCDCILMKEDRARGLMGCGDDCLNRMLMIECGSKCSLKEHCSNKRFQKKEYSKVEPFKTERKGWGLKALESMEPDTFIMEYIGEVIDPFMFHKRVEKYSKLKLEHYYFMALKSDEIIDATYKGNVTRFINHSCEPNAVTQKWTVNGQLRIGFFTIRSIAAGEEITFDYQFQRYGIPKNLSKASDEDNEEEFLEDIRLEEEIDMLAENGGLRNRKQILEVSRLMLRAEECHLRIQLIDIIMSTIELAYLRLFIDYHGLRIIWGWMVEAEDVYLKARLLGLLEILPIPNKTMLIDNKVYAVVERWAAKDSPESEQFLEIDDEKTNIKEKIVLPTPSTSVSNPISKSDSPIKSSETLEETTIISVNGSESVKEPELSSTTLTTKNESNESDTANENTVMTEKKITELSKFSDKIVIKSKTKTLNENVPQTNASNGSENVVKNKVSIGFLAQNLLNHWKDLKVVFRIPRYERQKRHADEAEADRRTREDEERRAQGLPSNQEKQTINYQNYTIAGMFGARNRRYTRNSYERDPSRRENNQGHFLTNSQNVNGNNSLISRFSREEYRKRFEYNVQYNEALQKYTQELAFYEQWRLRFQQNDIQQQFLTDQQPKSNSAVDFLNSTGTNNNSMIANQLVSLTGDISVVNTNPNPLAQLPSQIVSNTSLEDYENSDLNVYLYAQQQQQHQIDDSTSDWMDLEFKDLQPRYQNPLIILSSGSQTNGKNDVQNICPSMIDNLDFSQIKFESDNYLESMEKRMFDEIYPPAGIFYVTTKGHTYYISCSDDFSQSMTVKENITEPLPISFTTKTPDDRITDYGWKYNSINNHYYYYNKSKHLKQWHPPQDNQLDTFILDDFKHMDSICDISHASSNSSPSINANLSKNDGLDVDPIKRKTARRTQDHFRNKISQFVVKCLNPYMRNSCKKARITSNSDFKSLARKLTYTIVAKESKQCKHIEDLAYSESVKHKTKEFIKHYMSRFGSFYKPESSLEITSSPI